MHLLYACILVVEVQSMDSVVNSLIESYGILLFVKYRSYTSNMGSFYGFSQQKAGITERTNSKGIW
jgi:hypothetical protein